MNKMKTFLTDSLPEVCSTKRSCKKVQYLHFNWIARLAEMKNLRAIGNKFRGHSWLFRLWRKSWPLLQNYFGSRIRAVVAVAVVERFEQISRCMNCPPGQESGRCREETISGGSSAQFTIKLSLASMIWHKHVLLVEIVWRHFPPRSVFVELLIMRLFKKESP